MKKFVALCLLSASLIGCSSTGSVKKSTISPEYVVEIVEAEGLAPLSSDLVQCRNIAIADAQKRALELVVGVYVSAENFVSKAQLIEDNITGETEGYIERYDILKEWKDEPNFYRVKIKAAVRKEDLVKKLESLIPQEQKTPRVAFWVREKVDGQPSTAQIAEKELSAIFLAAKFTISDKKPAEYFSSTEGLLETNQEELENKLQSDLVVMGEASSSFNTDQGLGGFVSYRSFVSLKVFKTSTKDIIATIQDAAAGLDLNRENAGKVAISNVIKKAGKGLPDNILQYIKDHPYSVIQVKGAENLNEVNSLTRRIRALPSVRDCWVKSFSGNLAMIEFTMKRGSVNEVARQIELVKMPYKVVNVDAYSISLEKAKE
ncbi:MAG: hypothetical protein ABIJ11_00465 [Elusimicrobiota bacterium]